MDALPPPSSDDPGEPPAPADVRTWVAGVTPLFQTAGVDGDSTLRTTLQPLLTALAAAGRTGVALPTGNVGVAAALLGYETWAHRRCGFQTADITATDSAFTGVPTTLHPGQVVSILFSNRSTSGQDHLAVLVSPRSGRMSLASVVAQPAEELSTTMAFAVELRAAAGSTLGTLTTLPAGQFFVLDPLPIGSRNGQSGTGTERNMDRGLAAEIDVR